MDLGHFSLSLTVRDLSASKAFYEVLGFKVIDGSEINDSFELPEGQDWAVLKNGDTTIGLFQNMFSNNVLTFHPADARAIQKALKSAGIKLKMEADESATGPAYVMLEDPDGNEIMFDQP